MERLLKELVEKLTKAYGERLVSVVLYGSAASGDYQGRRYSDLNVLCVLSEAGVRELADAEAIFHWWRQLDNPAPLLLSEEELATSTDCFPIEFHDMVAQHRILYGRDVMQGITVDDRFYRAQVEHELRAKLLRLRQKAAGVLSSDDLLLRLMTDSVSTFCALMRHAIRLSGGDCVWTKRDTVRVAVARFGMDPAPFETLLDVREEKRGTRALDPPALLKSYIREIQSVIQAVDRLGDEPR